MRIVLATPLYPPDIAEPAPYIKELAKRLAELHEVTIVTYARLPEKVPGVRTIAIDKRQPLPLRLFAYLRALLRAAKYADVIYAENGASVELPAGLVSLFSARPLIMHVGDLVAHKRAQTSLALRSIEHFARSRAKTVITDSPLPKPEILPLDIIPIDKLAAYERSWSEHLRKLEDIFKHATS
ncbi:MAG: glycosyltransferase [Candidatus Paceibacterota bacterium]